MSTVPRLFPGETIAIFATGPSLTAEDVNFVRGKARVIAVNDSYVLAPWADVLWASDGKWWGWPKHQGVPAFSGLKFSLEGTRFRDVKVLKHTGKSGLELSPTAVKHGEGGGYAAINCAVHLGANRIVLLGYDLSYWPNGETHFFGHHQERSTRRPEKNIEVYSTLVEPLKALKITVINSTRRTALRCFPRQPLNEVFAKEIVGTIPDCCVTRDSQAFSAAMKAAQVSA